MKKLANVWIFGLVVTLGSVVASCNSQSEKDRKELARTEEEALKTANKATDKVVNGAAQEDMAKTKEDLEKVNQKLSEKQQNYLTSLKERETKIQDRIKQVDEKISKSGADSKSRLTEKRDKLAKERDMIQANVLEIQKPMDDTKMESVEKEIKTLIATIDKELATE